MWALGSWSLRTLVLHRSAPETLVRHPLPARSLNLSWSYAIPRLRGEPDPRHWDIMTKGTGPGAQGRSRSPPCDARPPPPADARAQHAPAGIPGGGVTGQATDRSNHASTSPTTLNDSHAHNSHCRWQARPIPVCDRLHHGAAADASAVGSLMIHGGRIRSALGYGKFCSDIQRGRRKLCRH